MNITQLKIKHKTISDHISKKQIKSALDILKEMVDLSEYGDYKGQWDTHNETYANIIKYSAMGIDDPQRQTIYDRLIVSILELSDLSVQKILTQTTSQQTYRLKHKLVKEIELSKDDASKAIDNLAFNLELAEILKESVIFSEEQNESDVGSRQNLLNSVFNSIWLADKFYEGNIFLVREIIKLDFPWYEKCISIWMFHNQGLFFSHLVQLQGDRNGRRAHCNVCMQSI